MHINSVLITGSNRGIGLEFVKQFLSLSSPPRHLFATCRSMNSKNSSELLELAKGNSNLHVLKLDVTNNEDIKNVASDVASVLLDEGLNLLINNAAIFSSGINLTNVTEEMMIDAYRTNTVAPLMIVQALLPVLQQAGKKTKDEVGDCRSAIVNISSRISSISDNKTGAMYPGRACKAAGNIITKSLSIDLKEDGVVAVAMDPGWVKTRAGGEKAKITTSQSVSGMIDVILSLEANQSGRFYNYKGEIVPW